MVVNTTFDGVDYSIFDSFVLVKGFDCEHRMVLLKKVNSVAIKPTEHHKKCPSALTRGEFSRTDAV